MFFGMLPEATFPTSRSIASRASLPSICLTVAGKEHQQYPARPLILASRDPAGTGS
jgi:hypothetical protein